MLDQEKAMREEQLEKDLEQIENKQENEHIETEKIFVPTTNWRNHMIDESNASTDQLLSKQTRFKYNNKKTLLFTTKMYTSADFFYEFVFFMKKNKK
jgi:hypothetical protein